MPARSEIEIEATPEEVWEALATEEGRERWLGEEAHAVDVEVVEEPRRLVWWWNADEHARTRVELEIVRSPGGARVIVVESEPSFPLSLLARASARLTAYA